MRRFNPQDFNEHSCILTRQPQECGIWKIEA
jgi:hypothetical protein